MFTVWNIRLAMVMPMDGNTMPRAAVVMVAIRNTKTNKNEGWKCYWTDKATVTCCRAVFIHKLDKKLFAGVPEWYLVERRGTCRRRGLSLHHWIWTQIIGIGRAVSATISTCLYQSAVISAPTPAFCLSCSCTSLHISLTHAKVMQVTIWHLPRATSTSLILVASCGGFLHRSNVPSFHVHQLPYSDKFNDAGKYRVQISLRQCFFSGDFLQYLLQDAETVRWNRTQSPSSELLHTTLQHLPVSLHTA